MNSARIRLLLKVNGGVGLAVGIGLIAIPRPILHLLGVGIGGSVLAVARMYGAELAGFNLATWLAATGSRSAWRPFIYGHIVNEGLTAVVAFAAVTSQIANRLLWGVVVLAVAYVLAYVAALPYAKKGAR